MQTMTVRAARKSRTPPIWYVRQGVMVRGPVSTQMLLQGVFEGRFREGAQVRCDRFDGWRAVYDVREVRALLREMDKARGQWSLPPGWLPPSDEQQAWQASRKALEISHGQAEPLLIGLFLAVAQTGADVGLVHVYSRTRQAMVTLFSHGDGMDQQEGQVISTTDAAFESARKGRGVMGSLGIGAAQRAVARRLNHGAVRVQGLAMVPLRQNGFLFAMIELGRWDHPFRAGDKRRLAVVAAAIERRYAS